MIAAHRAIGLNAPPALARDLPHLLHIEPTVEGGLQVQVIVAFIITRAGDW